MPSGTPDSSESRCFLVTGFNGNAVGLSPSVANWTEGSEDVHSTPSEDLQTQYTTTTFEQTGGTANNTGLDANMGLIVVELADEPAADGVVVGAPALATADGIVPTLGVVLTGVLATATADGLIASLPVGFDPTGILGDTAIKGIATLGNFVLGNPDGPSDGGVRGSHRHRNGRWG